MQMLSPLSQARRLWILLISINLYQVPLIWTVRGRNSRQHKTAASQCVGINWARRPLVPWLLRSVFVDFFFSLALSQQVLGPSDASVLTPHALQTWR